VQESWFTRTLLTIGGYYSRESRLIRGAKVLYGDVVEQATNRDLYKGARRRRLLTPHECMPAAHTAACMCACKHICACPCCACQHACTGALQQLQPVR
jgi:hypothetical protein